MVEYVVNIAELTIHAAPTASGLLANFDNITSCSKDELAPAAATVLIAVSAMAAVVEEAIAAT